MILAWGFLSKGSHTERRVFHEYCRRQTLYRAGTFHCALQDKVEQQWIVIVNLVQANVFFRRDVALLTRSASLLRSINGHYRLAAKSSHPANSRSWLLLRFAYKPPYSPHR